MYSFNRYEDRNADKVFRRNPKHSFTLSTSYRFDCCDVLRDVVVGGPLCESGDVFTQKEGGLVETRTLPAARVGDYLVIEVAGAYGAAMASNYNSKFLAPEVLVENGIPRLIRRKQSFEHLIANEIF